MKELNGEKQNGLLVYRAEKTVSVCELAPLCGVAAKELFIALGRAYLIKGEWAVLPTGNRRFHVLSLTQGFSAQEYRALCKENGTPVLHFGCAVCEEF